MEGGERRETAGRVRTGVAGCYGEGIKKKGQLVQVGLQPDSARPAPESEQRERSSHVKRKAHPTSAVLRTT